MSDSVNCTGEISRISSLILGILNGVSGFAAITGNFLLLITFIKNQSLREPSYYFMTSLATVDLLVGLVVNPFYVAITNFVSWQYREERLLQLESFLAMTASTIIMHSLTVMSVERFIGVNYPLRYRSLVTEKRSCIAIASVWTFGLSFNSAFFATSNDDLPNMWIACGVLSGLIPMTIILFCYGKILRAARTQSRRIHVAEGCVSNLDMPVDSAEGNRQVDNQLNTSVAKEVRRARKTAWSVAVAIVVVMFLSVPAIVVSIMQILVSDDVCLFRQNNRVWMWCATLSLVSSALDPWIYAMRIKEFRDCFKRTVRLNWHPIKMISLDSRGEGGGVL